MQFVNLFFGQSMNLGSLTATTNAKSLFKIMQVYFSPLLQFDESVQGTFHMLIWGFNFLLFSCATLLEVLIGLWGILYLQEPKD